ncbi:MAG: hypothetical protein OJF61_001535 [Rhodanobacteraceae bacterium]|jgi:uncharacterized protein (DUF2235 family)|nr:MAG: hypothetical protein OJF61_001535 [Rhodanobacteraceae bacterium]
MPRRLIALFDGTWNKVQTRTNVERLWKLVAPADPAGVEQICKYIQGVGVRAGIEHLLGGAFGLGLSGNVKDGYKWLSGQWCAGDEIWLFGFSRGAYTARSLGGLIRKCGLLKPDAKNGVTDAAVDEAYGYYRNADKPGVLVDGVDPTATWRAQHGVREVTIRFIGVWDTVGALGIPGVASWFPFSRKRYAFHDTDLSKIVQYAYQALALDEHRADFQPTKWTRPSTSLAPGEAPTAWKPEQIEVEQRWFAGAHSDIGGGEKTDGAGHSPDTLPEITLAWMQAKARGAGLAFNEGFVPAPDAELGVPNDSYAQFMYGLYKIFKPPYQRVIGGGVNETIDPSVWMKWYAQSAYRPLPIETAMQADLIDLGSSRVA